MKDLKTYKLLTFAAIVLPIPLNRIYLGEPFAWRLATLNLFYVGGIADLFYVNKRFDEAMAKRGFTNPSILEQQKR